jgi:hypothetical protein
VNALFVETILFLRGFGRIMKTTAIKLQSLKNELENLKKMQEKVMRIDTRKEVDPYVYRHEMILKLTTNLIGRIVDVINSQINEC